MEDIAKALVADGKGILATDGTIRNRFDSINVEEERFEMAVRVFYSYSHKDEALRDQLEVQLAMLKRLEIIEAWYDRRITAGKPFGEEIGAGLEEADIVLLLVSPDYLASDYCYEREMKRALERHNERAAKVIPVILRPCDWHAAPFGQLLAAPRDGKPITRWPDADEAFLDVVNAIKAAIAEMGKSRTAPAPPIRETVPALPAGPRSSNLRLRKQFTEADKDAFLEESFDYIARYFENSLAELSTCNAGVEGRFQRIDARQFAAVIYSDGNAAARCRIWLSGADSFAGGIAYSANDKGTDDSFNESLSIDETEKALFLRPMIGLRFQGGERDPHLTQEGGAEFYWAMFVEPLQH